MNHILGVIQWNVSPEIVAGLPFRWYGVLFAMGFVTGQFIMQRIFKLEGRPQAQLEVLLLYMLLATVIGARLGHCLFYNPAHYFSHPLEILKIWEGGLASHGATAGILLGLYLFSRKNPEFSYLWILDRIVIVVALGGCFIRLGNLMNSEIVGTPTDLPWAFVFTRLDMIPRHPAQLYEAISCLLLFSFLYWQYNKTREKTPAGRLFGLFVIILFSLRFGYEFIKVEQEEWERGLMLNMGQILSIPMILIGIYSLFYSFKQEKKAEHLIS